MRRLLPLLLLVALMAGEALALTPRWTPLRPHREQIRLINSPARFKIVPAGRRSGKTERAKRHLVIAALECAHVDGRFVAAAPTREQARKIFWDDLKALIPKEFVEGEPNETRLEIRLATGTLVQVMGLERPQRVEGSPLDGIIVDEFADVKAHAWPMHIRPALSTVGRPGWAWLFGVPEGRNHYWRLYRKAQDDIAQRGAGSEWGVFEWWSEDILDPAEIESARANLTPDEFDQEYRARFVAYTGLVTKHFDPVLGGRHVQRVQHVPNLPCYFGVDYGAAFMGGTISQFVANEWHALDSLLLEGGTVDELARNFAERGWAVHQGGWSLEPDPAGRARGQTGRTDHELLLEAVNAAGFVGVTLNPMGRAPNVRDKANCVARVVQNAKGVSRLKVHPRCKPLIRDLSEMCWDKPGRNFDKGEQGDLTHAFDSFAYTVVHHDPPNSFVPEVYAGHGRWIAGRPA